MLVLEEREKRSTRRKTSRRTNKLSPHLAPSPGIEPRPHWWEASALTTTPALLPSNKMSQNKLYCWYENNLEENMIICYKTLQQFKILKLGYTLKC